MKDLKITTFLSRNVIIYVWSDDRQVITESTCRHLGSHTFFRADMNFHSCFRRSRLFCLVFPSGELTGVIYFPGGKDKFFQTNNQIPQRSFISCCSEELREEDSSSFTDDCDLEMPCQQSEKQNQSFTSQTYWSDGFLLVLWNITDRHTVKSEC